MSASVREDAKSDTPSTARQVSRVLYICVGSPVPSKFGPARRNYHIVDQLSRYYDISILSLGSESEEALFRDEFGARVSIAGFIKPEVGRRRKFVRKSYKVHNGLTCDHVPTAPTAQSPASSPRGDAVVREAANEFDSTTRPGSAVTSGIDHGRERLLVPLKAGGFYFPDL